MCPGRTDVVPYDAIRATSRPTAKSFWRLRTRNFFFSTVIQRSMQHNLAFKAARSSVPEIAARKCGGQLSWRPCLCARLLSRGQDVEFAGHVGSLWGAHGKPSRYDGTVSDRQGRVCRVTSGLYSGEWREMAFGGFFYSLFSIPLMRTLRNRPANRTR
jgi:hypothetical protein